jgi:hypothetical protein
MTLSRSLHYLRLPLFGRRFLLVIGHIYQLYFYGYLEIFFILAGVGIFPAGYSTPRHHNQSRIRYGTLIYLYLTPNLDPLYLLLSPTVVSTTGSML